MLALTATPIPRTLALTFYGDLAIIDPRHLPPGRQPIRTELRDRAALPKIEAFIAGEAAEGRQTFVVVPLVAESEALSVASRPRPSSSGLRERPAAAADRAGPRPAARDDRDATMAAFAAGSVGRAGGDDRDRGRDRRAERVASC